MTDIVKRYPGVVALDHARFELNAGEIHCLVGENGAGKSTLVKILGGVERMDAGEIQIAGRNVMIDSPAVALKSGIGIIYQDFKLVPQLSVAENILLGQEPVAPFGIIDRRRLRTRASNALALLGKSLDTDQPVEVLSIAHRQIVEIARAMSRSARILVLDEPTSTLSIQETGSLFTLLRRLREQGVGIIYVSHRLDEIFAIGDRVTVLRDGRTITTTPVRDVNRPGLIQWMVGRELKQEFPPIEQNPGDEILSIKQLSTGRLRNITLSVRTGEILGIGGLVGSGRSELARCLFGDARITHGEMRLEGRPYRPASPQDAIHSGVGLLTEDRNRLGLFSLMNVRENITIANLAAVCHRGIIDTRAERRAAAEFVDQLRIKTPSVETPVRELSGGTRQKVVLARWLFTESKLLIFDEPTAGVDVGARYEIYQLLDVLLKKGIAIIVISSDLEELLGISHRIAVMCEGRVPGVLERKDATQERILALATEGQRNMAGVAGGGWR